MKIGHREVGPGHPTLIVAEVGLAHDGSLAMAHSFVDAIADTGADAVKFQCHLAEEEPNRQWRIQPKYWIGLNRQEYWKRTAFQRWQWQELEEHARRAGLIFLCSPFSVWAVRLLDSLVKAWKVASGEVTNRPLLEAIKATGKPVILSTGMCTLRELDETLEFLGSAPWLDDDGPPVAILQCESKYPTPADRIGLTAVARFASQNVSGLSDHSGTIAPSIAAVALGASICEVHVCFDRRIWGFDTESSITMDELAQMVQSIRIVEQALKPVDKDAMARELQPMRDIFMARTQYDIMTDKMEKRPNLFDPTTWDRQ